MKKLAFGCLLFVAALSLQDCNQNDKKDSTVTSSSTKDSSIKSTSSNTTTTTTISSVSSWTDQDRKEFMDSCNTPKNTLGEKSKPYCDCMMEKLEKKYPDPKEMDTVTVADMTPLAKECLQSIK